MVENQDKYLDRYKKILIDIIQRRLPGCKIYLFGSRANGRYRQGSDIDLALDARKVIDFNTMVRLSGEIEETNIPFFVDQYSVKGDFKNQVEKEMILWTN